MCPRKCLIFSSWNGDIQQTQSWSDPFKTLDHIFPLLKTFSWLRVSQLRTNSSPQPSRSYVIWLLLLLYCTHSDPPKQDSVLLLEHRRYAPNFALAVPPYWNTLLPYDMTLPNLQQVFFQMSRTQTHLDYPIRSATRTPYFPSLLYLL